MRDMVYILLAVAQCGFLYSFAQMCYRKRKPNRIRQGAAAGLFALTVFLPAGNRVIFDIQFTMQMAIPQSFFFAFLLWILYRMKLILSFSVCYFYFSLVGLAESAGLSVLILNRDFEADYKLFWKPYTLYLTVLLGIFLVLWIVLINIGYRKKQKIYFPLKSGLLILLGVIAQILSYTYLNFDDLSTASGLWLSMFLGSIAFFGVTAFLAISKSYAKMAYESQIVKQQDIQLKAQLEELVQAEEEKSKLLHDHKHDFLIMKQLERNGAYDKLSEVLNQKILESSQVKRKYYTGNVMVDLVLAMKENRAACEKIDFQIECAILGEISACYDVCILLSNLLDNAVEACCELKEKHPYIHVTLGRQEQVLWLYILNSSPKAPVVKNGRFISSKMDKNLHGYGLVSVRQTVEKYHGSIDFDYDDTFFRVKVLMELKEGENDHGK